MRMRLLALVATFAAAIGLSACEAEKPVTEAPPPLPEGAVFELFVVNEDQDKAFNIVFVPDESYGDMNVAANRETFVNDMAGVIENGYWQNQAYFNGLFKFNYYYMTVSGSVVERTPDTEGNFRCPTVTWPDEVDTDAAYADQLVLIHTQTLRDCASGARMTAEPTSFREIVHQTGHSLFGLPDEYCCDGFYAEAPPVLYRTRGECRRDPDNAEWRDCVRIVSSRNRRAYWRSQGNITRNLIMLSGGDTVWESGPADWSVMRDAYEALGTPPVSDPAGFAPDRWKYALPSRRTGEQQQ